MPEELQPTKLEVAGSNPASAANDGRVAQRIERVTISPPLVAKVPLRADAGRITLSGNSGFDSRRRKRRSPANLAAHLFSRHGKTNALETTLVAGSSPAPLSAGSSVG